MFNFFELAHFAISVDKRIEQELKKGVIRAYELEVTEYDTVVVTKENLKGALLYSQTIRVKNG